MSKIADDSPIWDYFRQKNNEDTKCICKKCELFVSVNKGEDSLVAHMSEKHPLLLKEYNAKKKNFEKLMKLDDKPPREYVPQIYIRAGSSTEKDPIYFHNCCHQSDLRAPRFDSDSD